MCRHFSLGLAMLALRVDLVYIDLLFGYTIYTKHPHNILVI